MKKNRGIRLLKDKRKNKVQCLWRVFNKTEDIATEIVVSSSPLFGEMLFLADNTYPRDV